jgi:drug/metabolite transporter (DMT)-like permease
LFLLGAILFLAYLAQTVGLKFTTSSKSGFITGLYIVFTPLFALFFVKEKPNVKILLALVLSVIGLALLSGVSIHAFYLNFGDLITIGAAVAYALQIVLTTIYVRDTDTVFVAAVQMIAMFLCSLPFNFSHFFAPMPIWILISLLFLGSVAGYLSIIAEAYSLKYLDPDSASVIFTLEPVFAGVASFIFLKERPTFYGLIGAALILVGMYLAVTSKTSYVINE